MDVKKLFFQKVEKNIDKDEVEQGINNIMNDNNGEELDENEFFLMNLLTIILDDSQNYPNFSHIKTISNVEKFIILYFNQYNEIKLKYEFEEENINNNKIKLFDALFVQRNRQKSFLIINKNIMELNSLIDLKDIFDKTIPQIRPIILDVKLIERKNQLMHDLSYMFSDISTIREIKFDDYNLHNIKNMSYMFYDCSSIKELPDISKWDTRNVTDMSYMFNNCSSIKNMPDISNWDTRNVSNMRDMFYNCSSLKNLPDISNWDTRNVSDMTAMFNNCTSLEILPDISSWNIEKLKNYSYMFCNCKLIPNFSILSKWKLTDDSQTKKMFKGCELFEAQIRSQRHCNFCDYLISKFKNFCNCCSKCCENFCQFFWTSIILICLIIIIIILLISPFYPFYSSFHLGKIGQEILEMKQEVNLIDYTNITHISSILNITNSSLIKKMSENKEGVIQNFLDKMSNKSSISLKKNKNTFKIYSIIIAITIYLNIILFVSFSLGIIYRFLYKYKNKLHIIFCVIFILNIISLIFEILALFINNKLLDSIDKIEIEIEDFFQFDLKGYFSDTDYLFFAFITMCIDLILTIASIFCVLYLFNKYFEARGGINFYNELFRQNK